MRKTGVVVAIFALGLVSGGALAQSVELISACVGKSGFVRIADDCRQDEEPLSWNQQGPAGPPGPAGVSGYEIVERSFVLKSDGSAPDESGDPGGYEDIPGTQLRKYWVLCPEGKSPLGGSGGRPESDRWVARDSNGVGDTFTLVITATCANV